MDDDVEITDVVDDDYADQRVPIQNQDMSSVSALVGELLSQYGWALLAVTVVLYLAIQQLSKRRSVQRNTSQPPPSQQDASFVARNQEAMEAARRKMQEELDAKAAIFREKQKQQEEEKRRQKIEMWENVQHGKSNKGYRLSDTTENASTSSTVHQPKTDKKPLRSRDYNPLSGEGGGTCSWRPGRRGPSSGG